MTDRVAPSTTVHGRTMIDLTGVGYQLAFEKDHDGSRCVRLVIRTLILGGDASTEGDPLILRVGRDFASKMTEALKDMPEQTPWYERHGGMTDEQETLVKVDLLIDDARDALDR